MGFDAIRTVAGRGEASFGLGRIHLGNGRGAPGPAVARGRSHEPGGSRVEVSLALPTSVIRH